MKHNQIVTILVTLISICLLESCNEYETQFSSSLMIGKWRRPVTAQNGSNGYDCYRYDTGGKGVTWDTSDDVTEKEAQAFDWSLEGANLKIIHKGEMGQVIPKSYTVITLSSTTLSYKNEYGERFTFSKFQ